MDEGRDSLLMSAYSKIPLQVLVLLIGVLVFVFYLFHQPPMLFNRVHAEQIAASARAAEFQRARDASSPRRSRPGAAPPRRSPTAGDGRSEPAPRDAFRATDAESAAIRARPRSWCAR